MKRTIAAALLASAAFAAPAFAQGADCAALTAQYEANIASSNLTEAGKRTAMDQMRAAAQGQDCTTGLSGLRIEGVAPLASAPASQPAQSSSNAMPTTGGGAVAPTPDSPPAGGMSGPDGAAPGANPSSAPDAASPGASSQ